MKKIIMKDFSKSALYSFLLLVSVPFLHAAISKSVSSFFYTFDNFSIPVFIGVYTSFWIYFNTAIKKSETEILRYDDEVKALEKISSKAYFSNYVESNNKLNQLRTEVSNSKINLEHINYGLQFALIFWTVIKFVLYFINICTA